MIRSVTLIRFRAGTDEASREAVRQAYLGLPAHIPELLSISPGLDLGLLPETADLAVVAEFATAADFLAYSQHPAQVELILPVCGPVLESWLTLQHEFIDAAYMRTYYEAYNSEDPERLLGFYHPEVELHSSQGVLRGPDAILDTYRFITSNFSDRMSAESITLAGATAVVDIRDCFVAKVDVPDFLGMALEAGQSFELRLRGTYTLRDGALFRIVIDHEG